MFFFAPALANNYRDPLFDDVQLLINANSGTSTIRDYSKFNRTVTKQGNIDVASGGGLQRFGQNCLNNAPDALYNGASQFNPTTGTWFQVSAGQIPALGTGDFTIEMWINQLDAAGTTETRNVMSTNNGTNTDHSILFFMNSGGSNMSWIVSNTTTIATSAMSSGWNFVSLTRASGVVYAHKNGVLLGSLAHTFNYTISVPWRFGSRHAQLTSPTDFRTFRGRYDDVRITAAARYGNSNYSVPTRQFPTNG